MSVKTTTFVARADSSPLDLIGRLNRIDAAGLRWVYLGTDDAAFCRWRSALSGIGPPEDFADRLRATADAYRQGFLAWLTGIAASGSQDWWMTRLAERNTYSESMFQDLCYVDVARQLARASASPLLVIAGNVDVLDTLILSAPDRAVTWLDPPSARPSSSARAIRTALRILALWIYYAADSLWTLMAARVSRLAAGRRTAWDRPKAGQRVLLHTCIDDAYFEAGGRDRYFTKLPDLLRRAGHDVVTLPWLFNVSRSRLSAFVWLRNHGRHLVAEDYYRPRDYVRSAVAVIKAADRIPKTGRFDGIDLRVFLLAARREQLGAYGLARFVQYEAWIRRLARQGVTFDVVVDSFENYGSERAFVMALRAASPHTLTVGFQHYMVPLPFQLAHWSIAGEWAVAPYVDVIVCTSPLNVRLLSAMGFPASRLRVGPSLRFLNLLEPAARGGGTNLVLILLPLQTDFSCELIRKALDALHGDGALELRVKFHPMMNSRHRQRVVAAAGGRLPAEVTGSVDENLARTACAVGAATNACIEVLLGGVPYVPVGRDTAFEMNPLHWFDDAPPLCRTPEQIRQAVSDATGTHAAEARARAAAWAQRHRPECLSPLNETTAGAFLAGTSEALESPTLVNA